MTHATASKQPIESLRQAGLPVKEGEFTLVANRLRRHLTDNIAATPVLKATYRFRGEGGCEGLPLGFYMVQTIGLGGEEVVVVFNSSWMMKIQN